MRIQWYIHDENEIIDLYKRLSTMAVDTILHSHVVSYDCDNSTKRNEGENDGQ